MAASVPPAEELDGPAEPLEGLDTPKLPIDKVRTAEPFRT
jgi:hypothetical protein